MINLGNGDRSASECFQYLSRLFKLLELLGGLQQCGLGPQPMEKEELLREWEDYWEEAEEFLVELGSGLGFRRIRMKRNKITAREVCKERGKT